MKKRNNDPGLEYMISLGFRPANSMSGVEDQIAHVSDRDTARRIVREIDRRADGNSDNQIFYSMKNADYNISLALTNAFDADIIRKACNWISEHKDFFGASILEVGCDCGVMSCYLAKTFPQSKIVAIDRCEAAIENAKRFAEIQGVDNIIFYACDLADVKDKFDTVFSMRTVHENYIHEEDVVNDLGEQAAIFQSSLLPYALNLSGVLSDDGLLISIERIGRNALLLGWMEALEKAGLLFDITCYEELKCKEVGTDSEFQAFICFKEVESETGARELFDYACANYLDYSKAQYEGWDAKIVFEYKRGTLIEGYYYEYPQYHTKGRLSLWTHKFDPTCLVSYQNNNGNAQTGFHDISDKDGLLEAFKKAVDECKEHGGKVTKME